MDERFILHLLPTKEAPYRNSLAKSRKSGDTMGACYLDANTVNEVGGFQIHGDRFRCEFHVEEKDLHIKRQQRLERGLYDCAHN
jgi:hypothetical protein